MCVVYETLLIGRLDLQAVALTIVAVRLYYVTGQAPYTDKELDEFCVRQQCPTNSECDIVESPYLLFPVSYCKPTEGMNRISRWYHIGFAINAVQLNF
jgi:hypothetical protein